MTQSVSENPYLAARNEWNERYGSYVRSARLWATFAGVSLALCAVSTSIALYQSAQVKLVPYIVEIDKLGNTVTGGFPQQIGNADPRVVRAMLGSWVSAFRAVTPDAIVEKNYIDKVYALLHLGDPSTRKVDDYFRQNSPFERAKTTTVSVEITDLTPQSPQSWKIDWIETERDRRGKELRSSKYRGIATFALSPPPDEAAIRLNPIGLYITDFEWTAQL